MKKQGFSKIDSTDRGGGGGGGGAAREEEFACASTIKLHQRFTPGSLLDEAPKLNQLRLSILNIYFDFF